MLTRLRSDNGFTIVEASVSVVIMGVLLAAVYSVVIRVNQDATEQVALSDALTELRNVAHDIDVELRQATDDDDNTAVQQLAWDEIRFLSYLTASSDLALHRYWLQGDCSVGCDVLKAVYPAIPSSDPIAYSTTPAFTSTMASGILASPTNPLFVGQTWTGGVLTDITSCNEGAGADCDFALVEINLRADPTTYGAVAELTITEQVRIRNAR